MEQVNQLGSLQSTPGARLELLLVLLKTDTFYKVLSEKTYSDIDS